MMRSNIVPPEPPKSVEDLTRRNVETIQSIEQAFNDGRTGTDIISDHIANFCGSMNFIWAHCALIGAWLLINAPNGPFKGIRLDPPPHSMLTTALAVEAIFLSTFILISQNRERRAADRRNLLELQINLLAEQETSQLLAMMQQLMTHVGMATGPEIAALQEATDAQKLVEQIEEIQLHNISNALETEEKEN